MMKLPIGYALMAGVTLLSAAELRPEAVQAWDSYAAKADAQMKDRISGRRAFLWADEASDRARRLMAGEIVVSPGFESGVQAAPHALIHDWVGAVFIRNATLADLFRVLHAYSCYKEFYKPFIADSRLLVSTGDAQEFLMTFQYQIPFANIALEIQYEKRDWQLTPTRGYSIIRATKVQEIQGYGHAGERRLPEGAGAGFIWRMKSIARYEQREGGVLFEIEGLALTRDIPTALRWVIAPLVKRVSINSLATTLQKTRDGVALLPQSVESCRLSGGQRTSAVMEERARK